MSKEAIDCCMCGCSIREGGKDSLTLYSVCQPCKKGKKSGTVTCLECGEAMTRIPTPYEQRYYACTNRYCERFGDVAQVHKVRQGDD